MNIMDISFDCKISEVRPNGPNFVTVDCSKVEIGEVLSNFTESQVVKHFGISELLEAIGQTECERHFGLISDSNL